MTAGRPVRTVLVVEDDPGWAMLTVEAFAEEAPEVRVLTVGDGAAALALLAADPRPDVVLLDLHLPDVDGTELLTELGATDPARDVVVVSASSSSRDRDAVAASGASAFLTKPTSFRALCDLARGIVDRRYGTDGDTAG